MHGLTNLKKASWSKRLQIFGGTQVQTSAWTQSTLSNTYSVPPANELQTRLRTLPSTQLSDAIDGVAKVILCVYLTTLLITKTASMM
jgi:hypothetical protein